MHHGASNREVREAISLTLDLARVGQGYLDAYSGEIISKPTIDHIVPLASGGGHSYDNLCVTSRFNNTSKHKVPLILWLVRRANG